MLLNGCLSSGILRDLTVIESGSRCTQQDGKNSDRSHMFIRSAAHAGQRVIPIGLSSPRPKKNDFSAMGSHRSRAWTKSTARMEFHNCIPSGPKHHSRSCGLSPKCFNLYPLQISPRCIPCLNSRKLADIMPASLLFRRHPFAGSRRTM